MAVKDRHESILEIVKTQQPVTAERIASLLGVSRSALRNDLSLLVTTRVLQAKPKVGYFVLDQTGRGRALSSLRSIRVGDVQGVPVVLDEKVSVHDGIVQMFLENVDSIFVISDGALAGVVSRKDFLKAALGSADLKQIPVGVIMTRMPHIVTAAVQESVVEAARKMIDRQVDALPVVEPWDAGDPRRLRIVGRISLTEITRLFAELDV